MALAWVAAGGAGIVAVAAEFADRARRARADLDRIGPIDWRSVQMAAMLAMMLAIGIAMAD